MDPRSGHAATASPEGQTALYRFFNAEGQLLYVGITHRLRHRWREHARTYAATWWPKAASRTVEWYPNRIEAQRAEQEAIKAEAPLYNVMHTPRDRTPRGKRMSRAAWKDNQGSTLLEVLMQTFQSQPFTSAEAAVAAGDIKSKATVVREINALVQRGDLVIVGARHVIHERGPQRDSTLYSVPIHEWIDGETNERVPQPSGASLRMKKRSQTLGGTDRSGLSAPGVVASAEARPDPLPPAVTWHSGVKLLIELGIVDHITHQGIRHIAETDEDWPFGEGREHPYWLLSNATVMATGPFIEFFRNRARKIGGAP
jgi:predicted GIY-YIG superfamily endonuclease